MIPFLVIFFQNILFAYIFCTLGIKQNKNTKRSFTKLSSQTNTTIRLLDKTTTGN